MISESHAAGVFHGTCVEVRDERLVIFTERVPHAEQLVIPVEGSLGDLQHVGGLGVQEWRQRRPRVQPEPNAIV